MAVVNLFPHPPNDGIPLTLASLFLDLDGTLVGFEDRPEAVRVDDDTLEMLIAGQARLGGRLAVLSGRSVESVDDVLRGSVIPVAGVHGLQRRTALAGVIETPPHPGIETVADVLTAFAKAQRGLLIERKGQSVAIHYRQAPSAAEAIVELVERLADRFGLEVQHGVLVAELRTPGPDKGTALRRFMERAPFEGSCPIFIGDDLTDESAFAAAQALGGVGILVGDTRPTAAKGRLADPRAVRAWIADGLGRGVFDLAAIGWSA